MRRQRKKNGRFEPLNNEESSPCGCGMHVTRRSQRKLEVKGQLGKC